MHELALAQQLISVIADAARENQLKRITEIKIIIGEMMAVVPEALEFSFSVVSHGTVAQGAKLILAKEEALVKCHQCKSQFPWLGHGYLCPHCQHLGGEIMQGRQLTIDYLEGDEEG